VLSKSAFVELMNRDLPPRPANFVNIIAINQGRSPMPAIDRDPLRFAPCALHREPHPVPP